MPGCLYTLSLSSLYASHEAGSVNAAEGGAGSEEPSLATPLAKWALALARALPWLLPSCLVKLNVDPGFQLPACLMEDGVQVGISASTVSSPWQPEAHGAEPKPVPRAAGLCSHPPRPAWHMHLLILAPSIAAS